ncbi:4-methylaminobutanoate oxidase (formaldehyde-forming) [Nymphon striatum]|nr:4-methylaminobutanoate oxidase (formaldehyde-forming) [Nymphon striatum]
MSKQLPSSAQVVIVGGGVIGCSLAYHLTKLGITDVVLLERKTLTCGTTWHAAGLVPTLRANYSMSMLAKYSADLYGKLEEETGQATGYVRNGSLTIATNKERLSELKRGAFHGENQAKEIWPLLNIDDVVGAIHLPDDGMASPVDLTNSLARGAKNGGAQIFENTKVIDMIVKDGKAAGVVTEQGDIEAEVVVNCAGMWAREFGKKAGVNVPLHAAEHFYVVTEKMPNLQDHLPTMRDMDGYCYYKPEGGQLLVGMFEPGAKPWGMNGIPEDFSFDQIPDDFDHLEPYLESAMNRIPELQETGLQLFFNGPESFTPDDRYQLGESPECRNYFVAAGFQLRRHINLQVVQARCWLTGFKKIIRHRIYGRLISVVITHSRALSVTYSNVLQKPWDCYTKHITHLNNFKTARGVRRSVLHAQLDKLGAVFGCENGWEPLNTNTPSDVRTGSKTINANTENVRNGVGVIDQSSFSKYQVEGPDVVKFMNRMVYTQWLNDRGGIEADVTLTRIREDAYLIVSGVACQTRDMAWLHRNKADDEIVMINDVTSAYAVVTVMGPKSTYLTRSIPIRKFTRNRYAVCSGSSITYYLLSVSWVGSSIFQLNLHRVYSMRSWKPGEEFGIKPYGYHTMNSLRMEKCYRHWGHDITDEDTALEGGLGFASDFNKEGGFIGKEALLAQKEKGLLTKRFIAFLFEDDQPLCYHEEPIYANGKIAGRVTSGMFGHTMGATIAMGYVEYEGGIDKAWLEASDFEIEVECVRYKVTPSLSSFYDPQNGKN